MLNEVAGVLTADVARHEDVIIAQTKANTNYVMHWGQVLVSLSNLSEVKSA